MASVAVLLSAGIYAASSANVGLDDALMFLLVVPLILGSLSYGLRGGLGIGIFASFVATAWWIEYGQSEGEAWLVFRVATCLLIGGLFGWFVDSREALVRTIERHTELSLDLIAMASFEGYFTRVNPAFTRTLGYTPEELQSSPILDFVHPDDREPTLGAIAQQTQEGREVLNFQNRYRTKDGSYRWLEWTSRPDERAHALIAVARDTTDRKRVEEIEREHTQALEEAVRDRTEELRQRNADLEEARRETLRRLALVAEYRDDSTHQHTERVGRAAALLADRLGLSERQVELIRDAAPLHDVGKVGVTDGVLLKPGKLTALEFDHVKRHAEIGSAILSGSSSDVLQMAEEIALGHHEWWDGSGYPGRLAGQEIPLTARIVALVDVFDALTHERPYKPAWPVDKALAEIHRLRGLQFDPAVVRAFEEQDPHELAGLGPHRHPRPARAVA